MDEAKTKLAERLKTANNVLVTVSRNPSVDQLSALLGLSLFLNKEGKHCAAVFSGQIPSTLEFLKPESTIQKNTDSLRDFIIALDKSKADKLRYKVEDNVVRIFITPYKSSIGQDDLEFSQGDFNVDVVVGLGVGDQSDLDEAITAHGRILHDATMASINAGGASNLGSINWNDPAASSLSELVTELVQMINPSAMDEQISTALLTGIVAMTNRFSNDKTSSKTMSTSSILMAAGANQQLVATKLEEQGQPTVSPNKSDENKQPEPEEAKAEPGTLEIEHESEEPKKEPAPVTNVELPEPKEEPEPPKPEANLPAGLSGGPKLVTEPPTLGGTLTANSQQNDVEPTTDPLSLPKTDMPALLDHKNDTSNRAPFKPLDNLSAPTPPSDDGLPQLMPPPTGWSAPEPPKVSTPAPPPPPPPTPTAAPSPAPTLSVPAPTPVSVAPTPAPGLPLNPPPPPPPTPTPVPSLTPLAPEETSPVASESSSEVHIDEDGNLSSAGGSNTLTQLEESVNSPHVQKEDEGSDADAARAAVNQAFASGPDNSLPTPSPALNAQPLGPDLHPDDAQVPPPVPPPFNPTLS